EDGIRDYKVTGVQTCALPIFNLESLHDLPLLTREHLGDHLIDAEFVADGLGGGPAVAGDHDDADALPVQEGDGLGRRFLDRIGQDRKSTRLNSSHLVISYAVF